MGDGISPSYPDRIAGAERCEGRIHILDLAGFSAQVEARCAEDPRLGLEQVSAHVAGFFSLLSELFTEAGLSFGGFAGDALIAACRPGAEAVTEAGFAELAAKAAGGAGEATAFRTCSADGVFWQAPFGPDGAGLVWGEAVMRAFGRLRAAPVMAAAPGPSPRAAEAGLMAGASLSERSLVVARLLTAEDCAQARPEQIARLAGLAIDMADAFNGHVENIVQDDKGLLVIIGMVRQGEAGRTEAARLVPALLGALPAGAAALACEGRILECQPDFSGLRRRALFGAPVNQAARALNAVQPDRPHSMPAQGGPAPEDIFVGRAGELETLIGLAAESRERAVLAALTGPAGIGKSALLRRLRLALGETSLLAEFAPADRYTPLGGLLRLAEASGARRPSGPAEEMMEVLAAQLPQMVLIENWQWCDEDSQRLILSLAARRGSGLLLVTARALPDAGGDAEAALRRIALGPLEPQAARSLTRLVAGEERADLPALLELSEGNPFWLIEAARQDGAGGLAGQGGLPGLLAMRARRLSPGAMARLRLHCSWRTLLSPAHASRLLAALGLEESVQDIEALTGLGWLSGDEETGWRPSHDILAEWGISDLPAGFERVLNQKIARLLADTGAPPSRQALHWERAGAGGRAAACHGRAAALAAELGAHASCLGNLEEMRRLAGDWRLRRPQRAARYEALAAHAVWGAGRLRRAEQHVLAFDAAAAALKPRRPAPEAALMASFVRSEVGQFSGNAALILRGIADGMRFSAASPQGHIAAARRASFFYYLLGLARLPVDGAFRRLIARSAARGDGRSEASLRVAAATLCFAACNWAGAEAELQAAERAASHSEDIQMLGVVITLLALGALFKGDGPEAGAGFARLEALAGAHGHQMFSVWAAYGAAEAALYSGDIEGMAAPLRLAEARRTGLGDHQSSCIIEGLAAQAAFAEGDLAGAEKRALYALRFASRLPPSNFSTLEGIAAPADIGARLALKLGPSETRTHLVTRGLAALKAYAGPFRLARPRLALVRAHRAALSGNQAAARKAYLNAGREARLAGMAFEERLALGALAEMEA